MSISETHAHPACVRLIASLPCPTAVCSRFCFYIHLENSPIALLVNLELSNVNFNPTYEKGMGHIEVININTDQVDQMAYINHEFYKTIKALPQSLYLGAIHLFINQCIFSSKSETFYPKIP